MSIVTYIYKACIHLRAQRHALVFTPLGRKMPIILKGVIVPYLYGNQLHGQRASYMGGKELYLSFEEGVVLSKTSLFPCAWLLSMRCHALSRSPHYSRHDFARPLCQSTFAALQIIVSQYKNVHRSVINHR